MRLRSLICAAATSLVIGGCGGSGDPAKGTHTGPKAADPRLARVFIELDGSGFRRYVKEFEQEIIALARDCAGQRVDLLGAVLDGQPITTNHIEEHDFRTGPADAEGEEATADNDSIAAGFAKKLIKRERAREVVSGSGQLQGLMLVAETSGLKRVFMWSDGVINEPNDNFNLTYASEAKIAAEISYWQPRLRGLSGKRVTIAGVGHGVDRVVTVERAHQIFKTLVDGNGGKLDWDYSLAQLGPGSRTSACVPGP